MPSLAASSPSTRCAGLGVPRSLRRRRSVPSRVVSSRPSRNSSRAAPPVEVVVVGRTAVLVGSVSWGNWSGAGGWPTYASPATVCSAASSRSGSTRQRSIASEALSSGSAGARAGRPPQPAEHRRRPRRGFARCPGFQEEGPACIAREVSSSRWVRLWLFWPWSAPFRPPLTPPRRVRWSPSRGPARSLRVRVTRGSATSAGDAFELDVAGFAEADARAGEEVTHSRLHENLSGPRVPRGPPSNSRPRLGG